MATQVPIPKLGQSEETVTIAAWNVKEGDVIKKGDILFEVETDKAVLEVESQFEGTLLKVIVPAGKEVPVMSIACILGEPGEKLPEIKQPEVVVPKPAPAPKPTSTAKSESQAPPPVTPVTAPPPAPQVVHKLKPSPRARKFAADYLIDLDKVNGSGGPQGRVTEADVKNYLETSGYLKRKITPSALNVAKSEKLELLAIEGSGDKGRITLADVRNAVLEKPQPMSAMRKVIAQRLTQSKQQIPHFYVTASIDLTELMALRNELKDEGINLSVNVFIVKAVALALREFPYVNAMVKDNAIIRKSKINIGVAVSVPQGLVVPVVRRADVKALDEIQDEIAELAVKARDNKLTPDEMQGGTFTISNMGMMNVENFGAIINPGEAAILAVSSGMPTPVVRDNQIVIRNMMKVTLSADHRVVDGAMGAEFVNTVKRILEDTDRQHWM